MKELLTEIKDKYPKVWNKLVKELDLNVNNPKYYCKEHNVYVYCNYTVLECFFELYKIIINVKYDTFYNDFDAYILNLKFNETVILFRIENRINATTQAILEARKILEERLRGER